MHSCGTVLIVDDEAATRLALVHELQSVGYATVTARNVKEAKRVTDEVAGELVGAVLDLCLPSAGDECVEGSHELEGGHVLYKFLRSRFPSIPVVIASMRSDLEARLPFWGDANTTMLAKPWLREDLLDALH